MKRLKPITTEELLAAIATELPIEDADISSVDWKDLRCDGASFLRCRFVGCRFAYVDFRGATFEDCVFTDKATSTGFHLCLQRVARGASHPLRPVVLPFRSMQPVRDRDGPVQPPRRALQSRGLQPCDGPQGHADQGHPPSMQLRACADGRYPPSRVRSLRQHFSRG